MARPTAPSPRYQSLWMRCRFRTVRLLLASRSVQICCEPDSCDIGVVHPGGAILVKILARSGRKLLAAVENALLFDSLRQYSLAADIGGRSLPIFALEPRS